MANLARLIKSKMTFEAYDAAVEKICKTYEDVDVGFPTEIEFIKYIKRDPWKHMDMIIFILEKGVPANGEQKAIVKEMNALVNSLVTLVYDDDEKGGTANEVCNLC